MFVLRTGSLYLFAIIPFWLWQGHAHLINSAAQDLAYIAHNRKMINNGHWYFGTLEQRVSTYHWKVLLQRGVFDVAGVAGVSIGWSDAACVFVQVE